MATLLTVAYAVNVIFDAPHFGYFGHHGCLSPHGCVAPYALGPYAHGYNHLASGAVPGYAVWPSFHHYGLPAAEEEAEEDDAAVEEASRKKRDLIAVAPHLGHHFGYSTFGYAHHPFTYSYPAVTYAHPYAAHYGGLHQIPHGAPFYKVVAAKEAEEEVEAEAEETAEKRKKRSVLLAPYPYSHVVPAVVPVETEYKYKTISHEDVDADTPADTTLVEAVEKEHTAKAVHHVPAYHHVAPVITKVVKPKVVKVVAPKIVKAVHHPIFTPYVAPVKVEHEVKYKTHHYEDANADTPADTTLVDLVEKEHTAKHVSYSYPTIFHH